MYKSLDELYQSLAEAMLDSEYMDKSGVLIRGAGNTNARVALIGEAPGKEEELQRRPFVGSAGKNLDKFLDMISLKREDIFITNAVKYRTTKPSDKTGKPINRTPTKQEIDFFHVWLMEELEIVDPEYVVTLGNIPLMSIAGESAGKIGSLHGSIITYGQYKLYPMYHPAAIIYNRGLIEEYKRDLARLAELLNASELPPTLKGRGFGSGAGSPD